MAVEYMDSPTGYIGLGETVGLGTITPQRKKRVRKGDRAIYPIAPTGVESYEDPSFASQQGFAPQQGFQQAYSAVPNVFERYAGLPGGARAGGGPGADDLRDVIFGPPRIQPIDVIEDNDNLDEELRKQTIDIDVSEYAQAYEATQGRDIRPGDPFFKDVEKFMMNLDTIGAFFGKDPARRPDFLETEARSLGEGLETKGGQKVAALAIKPGRGLTREKLRGTPTTTTTTTEGTPTPAPATIPSQGGISGAALAAQLAAVRATLPPQLSLTKDDVKVGQRGFDFGPGGGSDNSLLAGLLQDRALSSVSPFGLSPGAGSQPTTQVAPPDATFSPLAAAAAARRADLSDVGALPEGKELSISGLGGDFSSQRPDFVETPSGLGGDFSFTPTAGSGITFDTEFGPESFGGEFAANRGGQVSFMGMKK